MAQFQPNIFGIMYWGLLYGLVAGFALLVINFLSDYISLIWLPVFLIGVVWGGYRNYLKQKRAAGQGVVGSPLEEFKAAAQDIAQAARQMVAEQRTGSTPPEIREQRATTPQAPTMVPPTAPLAEPPAVWTGPRPPETQDPPRPGTSQ